MSATDELRRLLDERGVEYEVQREGTPSEAVVWDGPIGTRHSAFVSCKNADRRTGDVLYATLFLTPEQAVEATLGRGTCRDLAETPEYRDKTEFRCSECGYEYSAVGGFGCDYGDEPDFRYCPNCGRKVVDV